MLKIPPPLRTIGLIALVIILVVGIASFSVLVTILDANLGPDDKEIEFTIKGRLIGQLFGHLEMNQIEFSTGWKTEEGDVKSEALSIDLVKIRWDFRNVSGIDILFAVIMSGFLRDDIPYHYEIKIDEIPVWESQVYTGAGNENVPEPSVLEWLLLTPPDLYLLGSETGILVCDLVMDFSGIGGDWIPNDEQIVGSWRAKLSSGEGYVRLGDSLPDVIEEGEDVEFLLHTGFTRGTGWDCLIIGPSNQEVDFREDGFNGQDGFEDIVDFTIPDGWFIEGGDNECEIRLYNALWQESKSTFFVIDDISKSPGKPKISIITDYEAGSTVVVTANSTPNTITNNPIDYFRVYAYYGVPGSMPGSDFPGEYMIQGSDYSASNNSVTFSFDLPANRDGQVSIKINAIDTSGRASLGSFYSMDTVIPGRDGGDVDPRVDYPWQATLPAILVMIIIVVIISIVIVVKPLRDRIDPRQTKFWYIGFAILSLIVSILIYVVYWLGKNPGVMI